MKKLTGDVLILMLLAVGIVAGGSYFFRSFQRHYRADVECQLNAMAELKVNELAHFKQKRQRDGAIFHSYYGGE